MAEQATQDRQSTAQPPPLPARYTRAARKTRVGEVISEQMNKTIVVRTITRVPHPKFGKIVKQIRRFYAHDEQIEAVAFGGGPPEIILWCRFDPDSRWQTIPARGWRQ